MSFGKNLQYLRRLIKNLTREGLAEKLNVSRRILPDGLEPANKSLEIREQGDHKYAAIHIEHPFENPFVAIPGAYHTLIDYMNVNCLKCVEKDIIPCFETDGESMDVYIACK